MGASIRTLLYAKQGSGFPPAMLKQVIFNQCLLFYDVSDVGLYGYLKRRVFVFDSLGKESYFPVDQQQVMGEDMFSHTQTIVRQVQKNAPCSHCSMKNIAGLFLQTPHCFRKE